VIGYEPLVDEPDAFVSFVGVPEEHGTAELFRGRGLEVVTAPISEFEKLEGCVTCPSVRIRD